MATQQRKAKRKLSDISFEHDGAHVALTAKEQGGPANSHDYALVMKSNFSKEFVEKMQQVQVTMELPEFLRKFFNVYYEDAEVLARMMGYVEEDDEEETDDYEDWYEKRIQERLASFTVLKSMEKAEDVTSVLATLKEDQYLTLLKDQEAIEKALKNSEAEKTTASEEGATEAVAKAKETVQTKAEDAPSGEIKNELEKSMQKKEDSKPAEKAVVEMVEKSAVVALEKAMQEQKELLEKALAQVAAFEAEKKEAIVKAKTAKIEAIVKDAAKSAAIVKAAVALETEEDFNAFVTSLEGLVASVEKSDLFVEKGASVAPEQNKTVESPVAKAVKAQLSKSK